jgi:DegV family protein with EDD domain
MQKIKIIADSACDLDVEYTEELGVHLMPLSVHFGDETYYDRITIKPNDFYKKLSECEELPKTSQITPVSFVKEYNKYIDDGYYIICICFSSVLSGTYQSACIAKKMLNTEKVTIIDSKAASVGFGLIVREAALMALNGKTKEEIIEKIQFMSDRMEHIFAVGSLEMLKKGGRISTTQAVMGKLLNVKPILQIENGYIIQYDKVRGEKGIIKRMIETMKERGHDIGNQVIGLNFAGDTKLYMQLKDMIQKEFGVRSFVISEIGAAIGTHVGSGTVSVFFLRE